ncbi:hypothetical protein [Algoriphagus chordae]|uniref:Uncharacterized protein n=1 Tax=Algoriphagus chordae TaxID=237019 RepID=A0A2W7RK28_9BACT|nr:hypothetical protein [Algoriphagus chordae]PZX54869.1 hypothetical protein LV85_01207 [Algoriphagus chordae]
MEVLRTAILDMLRRKKGAYFFSTDVVQQMFPEDWEQFVEEVNTTALELQEEGLVKVSEEWPSDTGDLHRNNSLKISSPNKL